MPTSVASFRDLLKHHRVAAGLTQDELARRARLSPRGVSDLERGARKRPRLETVRLLAEALDLHEPERAAFLLAAQGERIEATASEPDPPLTVSPPASRTPDGRRHNLAAQANPLLGREQDLVVLDALLRQEAVRLVTLTGPGGIGKTRLSVEVASRALEYFPDGVWQVHLARLTDPALVVPTIAQVFDLKDSGATSLVEVLREYLSPRHMLLVVDNCEQVVAAAPEVAALLTTCPRVKVLATSRVPLHVRGEHEYTLHPLALPDAGHVPALDEVGRYAAVALFLERARAAQADFEVTESALPIVADICARLDGVPLAIELAAARTKLLPPQALLKRLDRQLAILTGGARDLDERHQTMRRTLTWSYDLLQPEEQLLFRRLAIFTGGCALEAAEVVCAAPAGVEPLGMDVLEGLGTLVDQNLVLQRAEGDEPRFGMLHIIREFALEHLEASGEAEALHRAHLAHYLALVEPVNWREVRGPQAAHWFSRLEREHDNLRAALAWARARGEVDAGLRLVVALCGFWLERGYLREGRAWVETFLERLPADGGDPATRMWALGFVAAFAANQGEFTHAVTLMEEALATARALGDSSAAVLGLQLLGRDLVLMGETERGVALQKESLARARQLSGDVDVVLNTLVMGADSLALIPGEETLAEALAAEVVALSRRERKPYYETFARCVLAFDALRHADFAGAEAHATQALRLARDLGLKDMALSGVEHLALVAGCTGHAAHAARLLGAVEAQRQRIGYGVSPQRRAAVEAMIAPARAALGAGAWAAAEAEGHALSAEETIAEALRGAAE